MQRMRNDQTECEVNHEENCSLTATSGCSVFRFALPRWRMKTFLESFKTAPHVPLKTFSKSFVSGMTENYVEQHLAELQRNSATGKLSLGYVMPMLFVSVVIPRNFWYSGECS